MKKRKHGVFADKFSKNELNTNSAASVEDDDLDLDFSLEEQSETVTAQSIRKTKIKRLFSVSNLILLVCLTVLAISVAVLFSRWFDYKRSDDLYTSLSNDIFKEVTNDPSAIGTSPDFSVAPSINSYYQILNSGICLGDVAQSNVISTEFARVKAKLEEIKRINGDIIGWIRIEGTKVNYPIVLGEDNDYYLTHAYNGEYLRSGTIFADYRNSSSVKENENTVLYGHNMANGSMFAAVKKFLNEDYFNSHLIEVYTFDGIYTFEPFSMLNTDTSLHYNKTSFDSEEQYKSFLDEMYRRSMFKKDITLDSTDKIITLSTCNNSRVTGRYALLAKLIKVER